MSDNPFITHRFFCPTFTGSPRAPRTDQIKLHDADARSAAEYLHLQFLRFNVTILQQINGNPPQMLARELELNPVSAKPLLMAAGDAERL